MGDAAQAAEPAVGTKRARVDGSVSEAGSTAGTSSARPETTETEESYRRRLARILQTLSRNSLIDILSIMGARYQPVYDEVYRVANLNPESRKVFVRSLSYEATTDESMREAMASFGEVEEAQVIKDRATGKSRGFGFVVFKDIDAALSALEARSKEIDGRSATILPASKEGTEGSSGGGGGGSSGGAGSQGAHAMHNGPPGGAGGTVTHRDSRRFIVRGLAWETTSETLRKAFDRCGEIEEGGVVEDKTTGKSRGFGFITMRYLEGANLISMNPPSEIDGRKIHVNLAQQGAPGAPGAGGPGPMGMQPRGPAMGGPMAMGVAPGGYGAPPMGYPQPAYAPPAGAYAAYGQPPPQQQQMQQPAPWGQAPQGYPAPGGYPAPAGAVGYPPAGAQYPGAVAAPTGGYATYPPQQAPPPQQQQQAQQQQGGMPGGYPVQAAAAYPGYGYPAPQVR